MAMSPTKSIERGRFFSRRFGSLSLRSSCRDCGFFLSRKLLVQIWVSGSSFMRVADCFFVGRLRIGMYT